MSKQIVKTGSVAQPIGPYSLGVRSGNLVFVSGTVGWRPDGSVAADIKEQCDQMYKNVQQVLHAAGSSLDHVVTTTTYLVNASDYRALNEVRAQYFAKDAPASAVVVVKELVRPDLLVEVEAVAEIPTRGANGTSGGRRSVRKVKPKRR
jgi:2-iminobutanoate/2-iminopropanoate deaminase